MSINFLLNISAEPGCTETGGAGYKRRKHKALEQDLPSWAEGRSEYNVDCPTWGTGLTRRIRICCLYLEPFQILGFLILDNVPQTVFNDVDR